jgi:hypothetical protein
MIFGSKTGYGRVDLILQPSHLQFRNEIDVRAPWSTSELSLASLRAIEPNRRSHSMRRVETQSFREVPTGSMACLPHQACSSLEAMIVPVMRSAQRDREFVGCFLTLIC